MKSGAASSPLHHRKPAHQNTFAYRHNPNSRKTKIILALPNTGLCQRCHDQIEWKKKYRKYKPLDRPRKCTGCGASAIKLAYHVVCKPCSSARGICAKCLEPHALIDTEDVATEELRQQIELLETHKGAIPGIPERERRALLRQLLRGADDNNDANDSSSRAPSARAVACGACCVGIASSADSGAVGAHLLSSIGIGSDVFADGDGCACVCHARGAAGTEIDGVGSSVDDGDKCDDDDSDDDDDERDGAEEEGDDINDEEDDDGGAPAILREALRRSRARRAAAFPSKPETSTEVCSASGSIA